MNNKSIIEKNKEKVKKFNVKKLGIFGSSVKGKKNPSDVDILIEFEKVSSDNYFGLLFFLEKLLKKDVDLVDINSIRPELEYIKREAEYVSL